MLGLYAVPRTAATCQERRFDGTGESRMREIRTSGLTRSDWNGATVRIEAPAMCESRRRTATPRDLQPLRQSSIKLRLGPMLGFKNFAEPQRRLPASNSSIGSGRVSSNCFASRTRPRPKSGTQSSPNDPRYVPEHILAMTSDVCTTAVSIPIRALSPANRRKAALICSGTEGH